MKVKYLIISIFMLVGAIFVGAGDVIVKNGELNITQNFLVDTNTLFVDSSNNRVGVGTSSPQQELEVEGDMNVTGTNYIYFGRGSIRWNGSNTIISG